MGIYTNSWVNVYPALTDTNLTSMIHIKNSKITFPVIFTSYTVDHSERVQSIEAFNDALHIYCFGRRQGGLTLGGMLLSYGDNRGHAKATKYLLKPYFDDLRAFKRAQTGKLVQISGPGNLYAEGVVINFNFQSQAGQDNILNFNLRLILTDSVGKTTSYESDSDLSNIASRVGTSAASIASMAAVQAAGISSIGGAIATMLGSIS